jgi:hypothetical protein
MATSATSPEDPQQQSPFMKLPPELRLAIYTFAFQNTVNEIKAIPLHTFTIPGHSPNHPPMLGALALLHTSRNIRRESSESMKYLASAQRQQIRAHDEACWDEFWYAGLNVRDGYELDYTSGRLTVIGFVEESIVRVYVK